MPDRYGREVDRTAGKVFPCAQWPDPRALKRMHTRLHYLSGTPHTGKVEGVVLTVVTQEEGCW